MFDFIKKIFLFLLGIIEDKSAVSSAYEKTIDHIFDRLYKLLSVVAYGVSGITIMLIGFLTAYFNILYQLEKLGIFTVGAIALGGIILFLGGLGLIYNSSRKSIRPFNDQSSNIKTQSSNVSPIEQAIVAIIHDYISERQNERQSIKHSNSQNSPPIENI